MALEIPNLDISFTANADLSSLQYHFVKVTGAWQCGTTNGTSDTILGILQNKPGSAQAAEVRIQGVSKLVASAAITAGSLVSTAANARGVAVPVGLAGGSGAADVAGIALDTVANNGEVVSVLLTHIGRGA